MDTIENLFCSPVVKNCREVVRCSNANAKLIENEQFIGIIYEIDGHYSKYYLENGLENLARFICSSDKDKLITNMSDYAVLNTIGKYIDLAANCINLSSFIKILKKYQDSNIDSKFKYKNL
jgi:hypothetical protein